MGIEAKSHCLFDDSAVTGIILVRIQCDKPFARLKMLKVYSTLPSDEVKDDDYSAGEKPNWWRIGIPRMQMDPEGHHVNMTAGTI